MNLIKVAFAMLLVALCIMLGSIRQRDDYALDLVSEPVSNDNPDTVIYVDNTILNSKGAILEFLNSGNFTYSESRNDIPKIVLDSIIKFHEAEDKFCDKSTIDSFAGGCTIFPPHVYRYLLNFVAYNDSFCLISYVHGGFVSSRMVEFFEYKGDVKRTAFNINEYELKDILKLKTYLTAYPNIPKKPARVKQMYIKDSNFYSQAFINHFKNYYRIYDSVALVNDSIIINGDTKYFTKIPTDLPLNKKVTYNGKNGKSTYILEITRINFSTIKYGYQQVCQGKIQYIINGLADYSFAYQLDSYSPFLNNEHFSSRTNDYASIHLDNGTVLIVFSSTNSSKAFGKFQIKYGKFVYSPELTIQP